MRAQKPNRKGGRRTRLGGVVIGLLAAAALLPVAGLGGRLIVSGLPPFPVDGDHALIEIATRQAAAGERLLGPYSRFGFHHPGPALFYLYAPFLASFGGSYLALCLGVVFLDLTSLAVVLGIFARSRWGEGLAWPSLLLAGYVLYLGPGVLVSPWNPHAILLPLLATLVAASAVMAGRDIWLPAAVAGGSLVLESHLGLLPVLAATTAVILLVRVRLRSAPATPGRTGPRGAAWPTAAAVALVAWLPVGLEAALHRGGNLAAIASFVRHRQGGQPLAAALRTVFAHIGAPLVTPWGATARDSPGGGTPWLGLALVVATALAFVVAARRRRRFGAALAVTTLVSSLAAVFATASVVGTLHEYLVRWVTVLAPLGLLAVGEAIRPEPASARGRRVLSVTLGLALAAVAATSWHATLAWDDIDRLQSSDRFAQNRLLGDAALAEAARVKPAGITVIPVESDRWGTAAAVAAKLLTAGNGIAVGSRWRDMFGLPRSPKPEDLRLGLASHEDDFPGALLAEVGDTRLVRLEPQPLTAGELSFGRANAAVYLLDGFDAAEGSGGEGFRWMIGRRGRILLPVTDTLKPAVIALEIEPLAVPDAQQAVTVRVDGKLAGMAALDLGGFEWYRFKVPYGTAAGVAVVELDAAWARSPFELERSLDVRPLSLRIRRLRLEPAVELPPAPELRP